jgi:hypothetical protein
MKHRWWFWKTVLGILGMAHVATGAMAPDFSIHRLDSDANGPTLLVIGGIQGDEPGGFNAASLLVTHYRIQHGSVWVVPNLNFPSIIKRSRGIHGDLNRKFAELPATDPEFDTIQRIKGLICNPQVDLVLNLHDGSGFFRTKFVDKQHNPNRWGQSIIIDQSHLPSVLFGGLEAIATSAAASVNIHLSDPEHRYRIRNTHTRDGDLEMAKTLTYFAITNGKPAFGLEVSKTFPTHLRVYYHLLLLETFMRHMGIRYQRRFDLEPTSVDRAITRDVMLALGDRRVLLDMKNVRQQIRYVPVKRGSQLTFLASTPLLALIDTNQGFRIHHGNRRLTHIHPQYFDFDTATTGIVIHVDSRLKAVPFGSRVGVVQQFHVLPQAGYRVNVIGFRRQGESDESGVLIRREDIDGRFSIDRDGHQFRVEVYHQEKFSGMVLVDFQPPDADTPSSQTDTGTGSPHCCRYAGISTPTAHLPPAKKPAPQLPVKAVIPKPAPEAATDITGR